MGQAGAHSPPDTEEVDHHRALERVGVDLADGPGRADARVRDHRVDLAEALHGAVGRALERVPVGDIRLERRRVRPALLGHLLELLRLEPDQGHVGSARASCFAASAPMPRAAPVMRTVRPETGCAGMAGAYPSRCVLRKSSWSATAASYCSAKAAKWPPG